MIFTLVKLCPRASSSGGHYRSYSTL